MHKDLNINSLRSTDSNGQILGNGGDNGDTDIYELDVTGKSVGFYDPYANGIPDPQPGLFVPGQNFSSVINGQITTFTVDGIQVTQGHFTRLVEQAYGSIFGLVEYQARRSAISIGYREEVRPLVRQRANVPPSFRPAGSPPSNLPTLADGETEIDGYITVRSPIYSLNWALNLSLLPQTQQGFKLGDKGVTFTAKEKSLLNDAFKYVNSKKCLDWINKTLERFIKF